MELFDETALTYDEWCKTPLGLFVDKLEKQMMVKAAEPKPNEVALDLGCGTGIYSLLLSGMGLQVTGIDISTAMLDRAKEKAATLEQPIDFIQGNIHDLPFADQSFDLVISNIVLEFVNHPNQVVAEALRVLRPGGRLVIGFIGQNSEWARMYEKQGKEKSNSVFAQARFFSVTEIHRLSNVHPLENHFALYVSPNEFKNADQAISLEKERGIKQQEEGAGYLVVKWVK